MSRKARLAAGLAAADDWLLDRVFQPVTDRLPERPCAFDVGMSLQLGAVVLEAAADVVLLAAGLLGPTTGAYDVLGCICGIWFYRFVSRQRGLVRPGRMNPLRPGYRPMRLLGLGFAVWSLFSAVDTAPGEALSYGFSALSNLAFVAGIYFVSCQPRPPGWRRTVTAGREDLARGMA